MRPILLCIAYNFFRFDLVEIILSHGVLCCIILELICIDQDDTERHQYRYMYRKDQYLREFSIEITGFRQLDWNRS
jgi:hypothetical protein